MTVWEVMALLGGGLVGVFAVGGLMGALYWALSQWRLSHEERVAVVIFLVAFAIGITGIFGMAVTG